MVVGVFAGAAQRPGGLRALGRGIWNFHVDQRGSLLIGKQGEPGGCCGPGGVPETLTHRNGVFEVLSEQPISGTSRGAHRGAANRALLRQLEADPQLAAQFNQIIGTEDVVSHMQSGSGTPRNPPSTEWHHPIDVPDAAWLLRRGAHRAPDLQPILHPDNIGGFGTHFGK